MISQRFDSLLRHNFTLNLFFMAKKIFNLFSKVFASFAITLVLAHFLCGSSRMWATTVLFGTILVSMLFGVFDKD